MASFLDKLRGIKESGDAGGWAGGLAWTGTPTGTPVGYIPTVGTTTELPSEGATGAVVRGIPTTIRYSVPSLEDAEIAAPDTAPAPGAGPWTPLQPDVAAAMLCPWPDVERILAADTRPHVVLYGPPGTGKTRASTTEKSYSITLTMETPAAELRGHFVPKGSEFVWHDGPALRAWREGARLVLNEIDQASGDALTFLHAILDDQEVARLTLPTGETVRPAKGFQVIATTNAMDLTMVLPEALLDRFAVRLLIDEPHPLALKALDSPGLALLVSATINNKPEQKVSLRQAMVFNRLRRTLPVDVAARAVFGRAADPATLASVMIVGAGG